MALELDAMQREVEQAVENMLDPAARSQAEATLLQFRSHPAALAVCRHILQHSVSDGARFQAAVALREVAVRQWPALGPQDRIALRQYATQAAVQLAVSGAAPYLRQALLGAAACLVKRGWLDTDDEAERGQALQQVHGAVQAAGGGSGARAAGLQVLEAVVLEFAPDTASSMGLPWDSHERCKASLQDAYLRPLFAHAEAAGREAAPAAAAGDAGAAQVLQAAVACLNAVLGWDFRGPSHGGRWGSPQYRGGNETLHVRPGSSWRDALLGPSAGLQWAVDLSGQLAGPPHSGSPLAASVRQLVVMLAGLSGDIFPKEALPGDRAALGLDKVAAAHPPALTSGKDLHLARVLAAVLPWAYPPQTAVQVALEGDPAELLDACRALNVAAPTHRAAGFERVGPHVLPPTYATCGGDGSGAVMGVVADLTCCLLAARFEPACPDVEGCHLMVEYLLEAWVELLQPEACPYGRRPASEAAQRCAGRVFRSLVAGGLADAAAGAHEDADEEEETGAGAAQADEWMARMAALGRMAAAESLALLTQQLEQHQQALLSAASSGSDVAVPLEQLCWLLRLAGYLLADSGQGETPLCPLSMLEVAQRAAAAGGGTAATPDPVTDLSERLLQMARLPLDEQSRRLVSPRLMEAALWCASRWADTYLCPEEPLPGSLGAAYGDQAGGGGPAVAGALAQAAATCLAAFPGEVELHRVVCGRLLASLVRRRALCRHVVAAAAWAQLAAAASDRQPGVRALAPKLQRVLLQQLCLAACGLDGGGDEAAAREYVLRVLSGTTNQLAAVGQRPDLAAVAQQPDVMHGVVCLVESMRGAMRGCLPSTAPVLLQALGAVMQPLLALQAAYRTQSDVTALLFKLAAEAVEALALHLQPAEADQLLRWVLALLQRHAAARRGSSSAGLSRLLEEQEAAARRKEIAALLKLLMQLTQRDMSEEENAALLGSSPQQQQQPLDMAGSVLEGLSMLIPLLSEDQLKVPKLCRQYFTLLAYMMEIYPDSTAALPGHQFQPLVATLEFGLQHSDGDVLQQSLAALAALAQFHCSVTAGGTMPEAGLGPHNQPGPPDGRTLLGRMLELCMRRLLFDGAEPLLEALADALLPLILCERAAYKTIGDSLLCTMSDPSMRHLLAAALEQLPSANGVVASVDRQNRRRFRTNLAKFANDVRSAVRMR